MVRGISNGLTKGLIPPPPPAPTQPPGLFLCRVLPDDFKNNNKNRCDRAFYNWEKKWDLNEEVKN